MRTKHYPADGFRGYRRAVADWEPGMKIWFLATGSVVLGERPYPSGGHGITIRELKTMAALPGWDGGDRKGKTK